MYFDPNFAEFVAKDPIDNMSAFDLYNGLIDGKSLSETVMLWCNDDLYMHHSASIIRTQSSD